MAGHVMNGDWVMWRPGQSAPRLKMATWRAAGRSSRLKGGGGGTDRGGCAFGENGGIDFSLSRLAALLVGLPKRQPIQWHGTQINLLMRLSLPFSLGATIIQFVRNQMRSAKNTSHRHRKSRVGLAQEECLPLK